MPEANFPSTDEFQILLSEVIDEIPEPFFEGLSGGIVMLDQFKFHPESKPGRPLYIMGEYQRNILGRQIKIYYGSFKRVYSNVSLEFLKSKLNEIVRHEFTHHLEYRAGLKDLEIEDARKIESYINIK